MTIDDFCSVNDISCKNCKHRKNIAGNSAMPVFSCDFMFVAGSYFGSYNKTTDDFACIKFERNNSQDEQ